MNKFTSKMVDELADKLLIGLSEEENKLVLSEFEQINNSMEFISKLKIINGVEPMTHPLDDFKFIPREDDILNETEFEKLFQNCNNIEGREVEVPKVV